MWGWVISDDLTFGKVTLHVGEKTKTKAVLVLSDDTMYIRAEKGRKTIEEIAYETMQEVTYERAKSPRTKTALLVSPVALFSKGKKHWLSLVWLKQGEERSAVLRLDKKNYEEIIQTLEARARLEVQRVIGE